MLGSSWKLKLVGLGVMLLGLAGSPLNHYVHISGLNWTTLCTSAAVILGGGGLAIAKGQNVHGGTDDNGLRPDAAVTAAAIAKVQAAKPVTPPDPYMLLSRRIVKQTYINSGQSFPPAHAQEEEAQALARIVEQYFPRT